MSSPYDIDAAVAAGAKLAPVPGFPRYQVSTTGEVFGLSGRRRRPSVDKRGYTRIRLASPDGGYVTKYLHRLVWEAFKGPIPKKKEVHHKDHDACNCALANLELVTHKENIRSSLEAGRRFDIGAEARKRARAVEATHAESGAKVSFRSLREGGEWASARARGAAANIYHAIRRGKPAYGCFWRYLDVA